MRSGPRGSASSPLESAPALESSWKNKEEGELEAEVQAQGREHPLLAKSRGWGGEFGPRKLTLVAVAGLGGGYFAKKTLTSSSARNLLWLPVASMIKS